MFEPSILFYKLIMKLEKINIGMQLCQTFEIEHKISFSYLHVIIHRRCDDGFEFLIENMCPHCGEKFVHEGGKMSLEIVRIFVKFCDKI